MDIKVSHRYLAIGVLFGLLFPCIATIIISIQEFNELSFQNACIIQSNNALIWIIDTAPLFLGLFALKAGISQQKVIEFNSNLQKQIEVQTEGLERMNFKLLEEIKERQQKETELLDAMKAAEEGVLIKDQFLSNMSHEIRTPLNGIIGMTNILLEMELLDDQYKYLSAIEYSSKNLLVIINDILDLSKINSEKLEIEKVNFNIRQVMDSVYNTLKIKTEEKAVKFNIEIEDQIPDLMSGDPVRLNQVLLNIVGNAVKFTEKGSVAVNCVLQDKKEDGCLVHFEVVDSGIGIKKENIHKVFESFSQANSKITRKFGGTGLGLPISKKLIELFGGELILESEYGKGSVFSFSIKFGLACKEKVSNKPKKDIEISDEIKSKIKILLAEDNKINQMVAKKVLDRFGFQSEVANDGKETIEKLKQSDFDLILMDIQMPELDGLEATRFIRKNLGAKKKNIKIMAMTASVLTKEINLCYEAGMDDFISKPFDPDVLYEKIVALTC